MKLIVYQQYAIVRIITHSKTNPFTPVATAIIIVIIIILIQITEGIILDFFFIAFICPFGVDKKQLPAILRIWQNEKMRAYETTSNPENIKTNVIIHDIKKPVIEHAKNPIILCFIVILGQICSSSFLTEKMLPESLFFASFQIFQIQFPILINIWLCDLFIKFQTLITYHINKIQQYKQLTMTDTPLSPSLRVSKANKFSYMTSPQSEDYPTIAKTALLQSRRAAIQQNRNKLFSEEKKENSSRLNINKNCSKDFVDQLCNQHRIQVEKLLLQISRLHDLVQDLERQNRHQINRVKQQSEQMALMRISSLRQCQLQEVQAFDIQLKTYKKNYNTLEQQFEKYRSTSQKKLNELENQTKQHKETIKKLVEQKNEQIYSEKQKNEKKVQKIINNKQEQMNEIKQEMERQMKKIRNRLEGRQKQITILKGYATEQKQKFQEIETVMLKQKQNLLAKLDENMLKNKRKQQDTIRNLKKFYEQSINNLEQQKKLNIQDFKQEVQQLMKVIRIKNQQIERNMVYRQTEKLQTKFMYNFFEEQNKYLRQALKKQRFSSMQENQLLKTKMAILHQNDIKSLTSLYEKRIQGLVAVNRNAQNLLQETENKLISEKKEHYEQKKKSDYKISQLQEEIIKLRLGMGNIENQMKEKLQNEKSMLMFTSKNFIKEVEIKTANNKFYEEQLRKLRHLLDIQANQLQQSERNVEQKIKLAEDQLTRLSNKILQVKSQADQAEIKYKDIIADKQQEIKRLNQLLIARQETNQNPDSEDKKQIKKLEEELNTKMDLLGSAKMRCQQLQEQIRLLRADGERLMMQAQINSEQARKHYKAISDKNLEQMKNFYERRLKELENDKKELERINTNQTQKITELIKKYKEAEQSLKQFVRQSKKRGDLEHRIINLGMDQNLVKNMAELFRK